MTSAAPVTTAAQTSNNPQQQQQHAKQPYQQPMSQPQAPAQAQGQTAVQASSPPSKRDLRTWWKNFKIPSKHQEAQEPKPQGIFGVPLRQSITYANVAISLIDENGKSYIYGYVPIVVAKCGVFLKEKATHIEGIFRLSGSEKRIKELKTIFDSPDRYGKGLVWDGYTVHDAANVLRRYLNDLPEPVVPLDLYEKFREPLRGATRQAAGDAEGPQFVENFDINGAIAKYQQLITELPPLNRQLLLYLLDLLAVFAAKSDENRMNSQNLAAIFQPGMLSHPAHAMAPEEYRLNQCVIIFLIENQDHFLIGMQGTAADEKTVREVQKGTAPVANAPTTPDPKRLSIHRSVSNASVGAESVAKEGMIRRNKSVSSRHSRQSNGGRSPGSPAISTTPTGGGLGRSNTVPSKKSPGLSSGRFQNRHDPSSTPIAPLTPVTPHHVAAAPHPPPAVVEEVATPPAGAPSGQQNKLPPGPSTLAADKPEPVGLLDPSAAGATTPSRERPLQSLFQRSPTGESERRAPNKLRKKKLPGSANPSAHSSTTSLPRSGTASPTVEAHNPLDFPHSPLATASPAVEAATQRLAADSTSELTPRASQAPSSNTLHPESAADLGLRHQKSPPTSLHSSFNEGSDIDQPDEQQGATAGQQQEEKERKRRWRLSRKKEDGPASNPALSTSPRKTLGANLNADVSTSSVGSSGMDKPRRSFTGESSNPALTSTDALSNPSITGTDSREGREESGRGLTGWIKNKYREAKETAEQRRNKSPPGDRPNTNTLGTNVLPTRGKSLDISRAAEDVNKPQQPQESKGEQ